MGGEPCVEASEAAFAEGERRVRNVLDLGQNRSSEAGESGQLGGVELPVREFAGQEEEGSAGGDGIEGGVFFRVWACG